MEILDRRPDLPGMVSVDLNTEQPRCPRKSPSATLDRELTANIVAVYVCRNQITSDQPWMLISTVHQALTSLGKPVAELDRARIPAVPIQ